MPIFSSINSNSHFLLAMWRTDFGNCRSKHTYYIHKHSYRYLRIVLFFPPFHLWWCILTSDNSHLFFFFFLYINIARNKCINEMEVHNCMNFKCILNIRLCLYLSLTQIICLYTIPIQTHWLITVFFIERIERIQQNWDKMFINKILFDRWKISYLLFRARLNTCIYWFTSFLR